MLNTLQLHTQYNIYNTLQNHRDGELKNDYMQFVKFSHIKNYFYESQWPNCVITRTESRKN